MAKRRSKRASSGKLASNKVRQAAASSDRRRPDFTDEEEAFFRAGAALAEPTAAESFDDLEPARPRPGLWSRLLGRRAA